VKGVGVWLWDAVLVEPGKNIYINERKKRTCFEGAVSSK